MTIDSCVTLVERVSDPNRSVVNVPSSVKLLFEDDRAVRVVEAVGERMSPPRESM
jgi:hypothetical protein